jgi:hypothetical protein
MGCDVMPFVRQTPTFIRSLLPPSSKRRETAYTLKMEAPGSFKTLVTIYQTPFRLIYIADHFQ